MDIPGSDEKFADFKQGLEELGIEEPIFKISSVTHQGLEPLMNKAADLVAEVEASQEVEEVTTEEKNYKFKPEVDESFKVERVGEHEFVVTGAKIERLVQRTNIEHQDGIMLLARKLKNMGVDDVLRAKGAVDGDDVTFGDISFEFVQ